MPLFTNNHIIVENQRKGKWFWHKDYGWQETVETKPTTKEEELIKKNGYMRDSLSNK